PLLVRDQQQVIRFEEDVHMQGLDGLILIVRIIHSPAGQVTNFAEKGDISHETAVFVLRFRLVGDNVLVGRKRWQWRPSHHSHS
ncbi:hypothetical protein, partial [Escherichia coli]|uniref:hypothetical protein n=1 Tax=Escherichia coli TaxID=562 RepID=UPI00390C6D87